jgi:hypothetical protein
MLPALVSKKRLAASSPPLGRLRIPNAEIITTAVIDVDSLVKAVERDGR